MQRKGSYPPPPGTTDVLGLEVMGRVLTEGPLKGKRVIALLPGGGYAQFVKAKEGHCIPLPESFQNVDVDNEELRQLSCMMEVWATAYQLLHLVGNAKKG